MFEGVRLKNIRQIKNFSQEALAEKLNVHVNTIRRWEQDKQAPDANKLELLATNLGVSMADLMEGESDEPSLPFNADVIDNKEQPEHATASDRLIYKWGGAHEINMPDTPENKQWLADLVCRINNSGKQ